MLPGAFYLRLQFAHPIRVKAEKVAGAAALFVQGFLTFTRPHTNLLDFVINLSEI